MKNCAVIVALLWIHCVMHAQSGFQMEHHKSKVAISFQLINNLIFIPMEVNGVKLNFLLDSGVDETILLSLDDKEEVSLYSVQKIKLKGLGSREPIEGLRSSGNRLSCNGLVDHDHELYIVLDQSFNFSSHIGIPVNGIIGYHFFKNHLVEIDYDRKKIFVYGQGDKRREKLQKYSIAPITIERNKPYINATVTVDHQEIPSKLLVDLGNSDALWLFENRDMGIAAPPAKIEDYLGRGFSGDIHGWRARIAQLRINDFTFEEPLASFPDSISISNVNRVPNRVGSIGGEILKRFRVVLDYPEGKIFLRKSHHFGEIFSYNMSGIELQNEGMQWVQETMRLPTVNLDNTYDGSGNKAQSDFKLKFTLKPVFSISGIRKNSPAAACGLQVGDVLVKIDNVEAYRYTLQSINNLLKSEEGKWLNFEVERNGKILKFRFQLKNIL